MEDIISNGKELVEQAKQADEEIFLQLCEQYRIRAANKYDEHDWILYRHGIGFSPRGNIMVIAAEKKAGKTWMGMSICAAVLSGDFLGMQCRLEGAKVLFFDTEQDAIDGQRIQRRVHYVMKDHGWVFERDEDRFQLFHLREVEAEQRLKFVVSAIRFLRPDLVFVDGIRDLLKDFNDLEQSARVIQELMTLSSECQCAIWTVLHVNPNSEKMRGHLGTELGNKVADILFMTKEKNPNDEDDVVYKVEETDSRGHKDIKTIKFIINDGLPYGIPQELSDGQIEQRDTDRAEELRSIMRKYIHEPAAISKTALQKSLATGEHIGGSKAWKMITEAIGIGALEVVIGGKLRVCNAPVSVNNDDLPFDPPD